MRMPIPVTALLTLALAGTLAAQTKPVHSAHPAAFAVAGGSRHAAVNGGRPANLPPPSSNLILMPQGLPRAMALPQAAFWEQRDMMAEIRNNARRGYIPVMPVPLDAPGVTDYTWFPAGWKAYGFPVPAGGNLHVRLHHPKEGWFRLLMVDRWGQMSLGMLQNKIPTGNPEVSFRNQLKGPQLVYVIVDDPGWMSSKTDPYQLSIDRSWDPAKTALPPIPSVVGVFATKKLAPDVEEHANVAPPKS